MKSDYQYPLNLDWSTEEMVIVTDFYAEVEKAYESSVFAENFLESYREFKNVVTSIGEEKRMGKQFEEASGYYIYRTVQMAKEK